MRFSTFGCLLVMLACALSAHAQWRDWDADFDEEKKSWKEIQAQIPAYPKAENLVKIDVGRASPHRFLIDTSSISLGEDGVMRFTSVVKTSGGATNVTFEGMRCETREQKVYAFGHSDGSWMRARDPKWRRIEPKDLTPQHYVLYREYFCSERTRPTPVNRAVDALKRGVGFAAARSNFD